VTTVHYEDSRVTNYERQKILKSLRLPDVADDSDQVNDRTPLHMACLKGYLRIVKLLVKKGACVDASSVDGFTPLHIACQIGNLPIVEFLVSHGADIVANTKTYVIPLQIACHHGSYPIVEFLWSKHGRKIPNKIPCKNLLIHAFNGHDADTINFISSIDTKTLDRPPTTMSPEEIARLQPLLSRLGITAPLVPKDQTDAQLQVACTHGLYSLAEQLVHI
jgi:ankyrin repeat protein